MKHALAAILAGTVASSATADLVGLVGGQTNVALDFKLIEAATGLALSGVSDGVINVHEGCGQRPQANAGTRPKPVPTPRLTSQGSS